MFTVYNKLNIPYIHTSYSYCMFLILLKSNLNLSSKYLMLWPLEYSVSRLSKWHLYPPCLVVSTIVIYWNLLNKNSCASHGKLSFNTCPSTCMQHCGPWQCGQSSQQPGHFKLLTFPTPRVTKWCFNDLVCEGFWLTHVGITECIVIL